MSNNEEELAHLLVRLSKNIDNLVRVRNATPNDYITGLDEFIIDLNVYVRSKKAQQSTEFNFYRELEQICIECRCLNDRRSGSWFKRTIRKSWNGVNAETVKNRIVKLKERVNDVQQDYMVGDPCLFVRPPFYHIIPR